MSVEVENLTKRLRLRPLSLRRSREREREGRVEEKEKKEFEEKKEGAPSPFRRSQLNSSLQRGGSEAPASAPERERARKRVKDRSKQSKKEPLLAWERQKREERESTRPQLPLVFFLQFRSLFFPCGKSHLGLVVDRQHDLVDAGVLEGLFRGE